MRIRAVGGDGHRVGKSGAVDVERRDEMFAMVLADRFAVYFRFRQVTDDQIETVEVVAAPAEYAADPAIGAAGALRKLRHPHLGKKRR